MLRTNDLSEGTHRRARSLAARRRVRMMLNLMDQLLNHPTRSFATTDASARSIGRLLLSCDGCRCSCSSGLLLHVRLQVVSMTSETSSDVTYKNRFVRRRYIRQRNERTLRGTGLERELLGTIDAVPGGLIDSIQARCIGGIHLEERNFLKASERDGSQSH